MFLTTLFTPPLPPMILSLLNSAACPAESVQLYREAGAVHLFTQNTGHVFVMPGISLYNSLLFSMYPAQISKIWKGKIPHRWRGWKPKGRDPGLTKDEIPMPYVVL